MIAVGAILPRGWRRQLAEALREGRRSRLLRNIVTLVSGTAGAQAVTLAFMPVITRLYGPEAYGVLGAFVALTMMLIPVAALTYPLAIVLPRRDAEARSLVRLSLALSLAVSLLVAALFGLFGAELAQWLGISLVAPYLLLVPLAMFFGALLEVAQQWNFRRQSFRLTAGAAALHSTIFNGLRSLAGLFYPSAGVLVSLTSLNQALHLAMLLGGMRLARRAEGTATEADAGAAAGSLEMAVRHRDFPLYRAPQVLINGFSQHLPTLVLAAFFGPIAAGFFALCKQALSMPTNLIGKSVGDVYYPRLSAAIHAGEPILPLLLRGVGALALVGLVPFGLIFAVGPELFAWVFGESWRQAGEFARWLALGEYCLFIARPCVVAVPTLSLQRHFLIFELASTTLRVVALLGAALLAGEALATVQSFVLASAFIYLLLVALVLRAARRHCQ